MNFFPVDLNGDTSGSGADSDADPHSFALNMAQLSSAAQRRHNNSNNNSADTGRPGGADNSYFGQRVVARSIMSMMRNGDFEEEHKEEHELTREDWNELGVTQEAAAHTAQMAARPLPPIYEPSNATQADVQHIRRERALQKKRYKLRPVGPDGQRKNIVPVKGNTIRVIDIYLAFLNAHTGQSRNDTKRRLNRIFSNITGSYTHVEMIFIVENTKTKKRRRLVSSIFMVIDGNARSRLRIVEKDKYHRPERWSFFYYRCSDEVKQLMFQYEYAMLGAEFNALGMFWNFIMPFDSLRVDRLGRYVFCSEEIIRNLKYSEPDEYADLKAYCTGPLELFEYITHKNRFVAVQEPSATQEAGVPVPKRYATSDTRSEPSAAAAAAAAATGEVALSSNVRFRTTQTPTQNTEPLTLTNFDSVVDSSSALIGTSNEETAGRYRRRFGNKAE